MNRKDHGSFMGGAKKRDNFDFEIQFYESILKESPNFIEALMALGDLYTQKGLFEKGLDIDLKLARLRPYDPIIFYNLACSYSLMHDLPAALKTIKRSIECGYDDFEYLLKDSDLGGLLSDEHFREYLKEVKDRKSSSCP